MNQALIKSTPENLLPAEPGAAEAHQLCALHKDAQDGLRRVVALGLYCFYLKSLCKSQNGFGLFLKDHCPELAREKAVSQRAGKHWVPTSSLSAAMQITMLVAKQCGLNMHEAAELSDGGRVLQLPPAELTPPQKKFVQAVFDFTEGKSQRQLLAEARGASKGEEGATAPAREPHGGKTSNIAAVELVQGVIRQMELILSPKGMILARIPDALRDHLLETGIELNNRIREIKKPH